MIVEVSKNNTFEEFLRTVAGSVSPVLISPSAFSDMEVVARMLPATLAYNTFGFECRMGEDRPRADFLVQANPSHGRDSLAGLDAASALSASVMTDPIWKRVHDFAVCWADPASALYRPVGNVCLEFDVDGPAHGIPRPSVFLGFPPGQDHIDGRGGEAKAAGYATAVETATRLLCGCDLPSETLEALSGCFRPLRRHEYVFFAGLMIARGAEAVRLCIRLDSTERTFEYLAQVGWPGSERDLRGILELARLVDYTWLNMDVGETVHPKIGLEFFFERHKQPAREPRWGVFLDSLVRDGLCTPGKRDALLAYPGYSDENAQGLHWPQALRQTSQLLGGRSLSTFVRTLNHVKITYRPGEPLEAKAYLAATHHWQTPSTV